MQIVIILYNNIPNALYITQFMFIQEQHNLLLEGHTIDCSRPIFKGYKIIFHAEDNYRKRIAAKYIHT